MDIAEIKKRVKRPEREVRVCLDADLAAEHDRLDRELQTAQRDGALSLADTGKAAELARQVRDLQERMEESTVPFRVRALSGFERDELLEKYPPREGKDEWFDATVGQFYLLAKACVDPAMTEDDARELHQEMGAAEFGKLTVAAWQLSNQPFDVPFSLAASVTLRSSEPKQS